MMAKSKSTIENAAVSGLPLDGRDVASVSRDGRVVTLRHVWPDNSTDGRIWAGVRRAAWGLAQQVADRAGRSVEIMSAHSDTLDQIEPS